MRQGDTLKSKQPVWQQFLTAILRSAAVLVGSWMLLDVANKIVGFVTYLWRLTIVGGLAEHKSADDHVMDLMVHLVVMALLWIAVLIYTAVLYLRWSKQKKELALRRDVLSTADAGEDAELRAEGQLAHIRWQRLKISAFQIGWAVILVAMVMNLLEWFDYWTDFALALHNAINH